MSFFAEDISNGCIFVKILLSMEIVKLKPACKDYIWGGDLLKKWGKESESSTIAECWELSFNPSGPSVIASGKETGKLLMDVATKEDIGEVPASFAFFPVLIKLINSAANLSVQVHPSDEYALKNEGQFGKTEMWYVISAEPGCGLYVGFKQKTSPEEVASRIEDGTIMDILNFIEVKPGETYFIPSGTVHAIGKGVTVIEIQQNSTLTYRLYDYKRIGKDGKERELHVEKALKVLKYEPYERPDFQLPLVGSCPYFTSYRYQVDEKAKVEAKPFSFASITFLSGKGTVEGIPYRKGDTFFIPAGKIGHIDGTGDYVLTEVDR